MSAEPREKGAIVARLEGIIDALREAETLAEEILTCYNEGN